MKQIVDPFMPVSRPANPAVARRAVSQTPHVQPSQPQPSTPTPAAAARPHVASRSRNIDGVVPAKPQPRGYRGPAGPLHAQYAQAPQPPLQQRQPQPPRLQAVRSTVPASKASPKAEPAAPASGKTTAKNSGKAKKDSISTVWLVTGAAVAGLAMFSVLAGQVAIAVYAVVALWRRWPSNQSFMLALVMFAGIITALVIPNFKDVADNLAVYAFLLLAIGTVSLAREARRDMRQIASD